MRTAVGTLLFVGVFGLSGGQEKSSADHVVPPPVGLEVGHQAPAFTLTDQFGHEQSNETLKRESERGRGQRARSCFSFVDQG